MRLLCSDEGHLQLFSCLTSVCIFWSGWSGTAETAQEKILSNFVSTLSARPLEMWDAQVYRRATTGTKQIGVAAKSQTWQSSRMHTAQRKTCSRKESQCMPANGNEVAKVVVVGMTLLGQPLALHRELLKSVFLFSLWNGLCRDETDSPMYLD